MVPGLEECFLNSEASEATEIAELVFHPSAFMQLHCLWVVYSFRGASLVPDLMTTKVWKGLYWIRLSLMGNLSIHPLPTMLRLTEGSTMNTQGCCYALLIWTGQIQSEYHSFHALWWHARGTAEIGWSEQSKHKPNEALRVWSWGKGSSPVW